MKDQLYYYAWGNEKTYAGRFRMQFKGRKCKVLHRGKMNSCLIQFVDNDELLNCSRNAIRKVRA